MTMKMTSQYIKVRDVKISGYSLLDIRLWFYSLAFVHLVMIAVVTLSIDVTGDEDAAVRAYNQTRWKLLTCLFNLVSLGYMPLCLYCDWCEKRGDEPLHVEQLRVLRDVVMTAILMPITTLADVLFWTLFQTYPNLLAPPRLLEYMPYWAQHSLHTVSMITVLMDLVLTPRRKPDSMKPRLALMMGLATSYCVMLYVCLLNGEAVYAFLETASNTVFLAESVSFLAALTILYFAQWPVIGYIWGHQRIESSKKMYKIK